MIRLASLLVLVAAVAAADAVPATLVHFKTPSVNIGWALGARRVLGYGKSLRIGPFLCTSRRSGLTCSSRTRHGFFLSRDRINLY